jgi:hypothetical protein
MILGQLLKSQTEKWALCAHLHGQAAQKRPAGVVSHDGSTACGSGG